MNNEYCILLSKLSLLLFHKPTDLIQAAGCSRPQELNSHHFFVCVETCSKKKKKEKRRECILVLLETENKFYSTLSLCSDETHVKVFWFLFCSITSQSVCIFFIRYCPLMCNTLKSNQVGQTKPETATACIQWLFYFKLQFRVWGNTSSATCSPELVLKCPYFQGGFKYTRESRVNAKVCAPAPGFGRHIQIVFKL